MLHQLERLAFDIILATNHVGEDGWQCLVFQFGCCDLHVELASVLVLQIESYIILLLLLLVDELKQEDIWRLTTELRRMLVCVLCSFFVSSTGDIKQTIDSRFNRIRALVPQFKGLPSVSGVFVDDAVDELLYGCHILRSAELERVVSKMKNKGAVESIGLHECCSA
jgi:hypothetical protein